MRRVFGTRVGKRLPGLWLRPVRSRKRRDKAPDRPGGQAATGRGVIDRGSSAKTGAERPTKRTILAPD